MRVFPLLLSSCLLSSICYAETYSQKDLNEELVTAANWQQLSPEYDALLYQAFNRANDTLTEAIRNTPAGKKPAIVADIDDTLLESAAYFSSLIGTHNTKSIERSLKWWTTHKSEALPGSVDLITKAKSLGVEIFYISGRFDSVKEATIKSLKEADFPVASTEHVLLQQPLNKTLSKEDKRQLIRDKGYHLIILLGDHLEDTGPTPKDHYTIKKQWVSEQQHHYGRDWFTLPNIIYGTWQDSVTQNYSKLSPEEAHQANLAALPTNWTHEAEDHSYAQQNIATAVWQHTSAEYDALTYQTYNLATDIIATQQKNNTQITIAIDVNGSLLRYQAEEVDNKNSQQLNKSQPSSGAKEFIQLANNTGAKIFYISELDATESEVIEKLSTLGLPDISKETIIAKEEFCPKKTFKCDISLARRLIKESNQNMKAREITLHISDSLEDFDFEQDSINQKPLNEQIKTRLGREYLLIPNPLDQKRMAHIYSAYSANYRKMSGEQQSKARRELAKDWN